MDRRPGWVQVELEGWVWIRSLQIVDRDGFDLVFRTWGDTKVARVRIGWIAIGAVKSEDDWELY